jgi:Stage II sporulation protein E (SpoIIE)
MAEDLGTDLLGSAVALFDELLYRTHLSAPAELARHAADAARAIGATRVVVYLVDYEQTRLVPLPAPDAAADEAVSIQGSVAGRAFMTTSVIELEGDAGRGRRVWLPLLDGTERVGVLEMTFGARHASLPQALVSLCERYAHLVATQVVCQEAYSDVFERVRRTKPMTMASELLWELTPPLVLATEDFVLAAMLEPCYDIGGDAFDYALNEGVLHLAVFDAMGHGLTAAGAATFALSAYRHSRRGRHALAQTHASIDAAVGEQYPDDRFVTALLAELEVATGQLRWVTSGHPPPLLLRGSRVLKTLDVTPALPLGVRLGSREPFEGRASLEPGDMLLLYTDGLTEARRPGGGLFTAARLGEFIKQQASAGQPAPETLRRLREAIIERGAGALHDDATALLLEWRRGTERALVPEPRLPR